MIVNPKNFREMPGDIEFLNSLYCYAQKNKDFINRINDGFQTFDNGIKFQAAASLHMPLPKMFSKKKLDPLNIKTYVCCRFMSQKLGVPYPFPFVGHSGSSKMLSLKELARMYAGESKHSLHLDNIENEQGPEASAARVLAGWVKSCVHTDGSCDCIIPPFDEVIVAQLGGGSLPRDFSPVVRPGRWLELFEQTFEATTNVDKSGPKVLEAAIFFSQVYRSIFCQNKKGIFSNRPRFKVNFDPKNSTHANILLCVYYKCSNSAAKYMKDTTERKEVYDITCSILSMMNYFYGIRENEFEIRWDKNFPKVFKVVFYAKSASDVFRSLSLVKSLAEIKCDPFQGDKNNTTMTFGSLVEAMTFFSTIYYTLWHIENINMNANFKTTDLPLTMTGIPGSLFASPNYYNYWLKYEPTVVENALKSFGTALDVFDDSLCGRILNEWVEIARYIPSDLLDKLASTTIYVDIKEKSFKDGKIKITNTQSDVFNAAFNRMAFIYFASYVTGNTEHWIFHEVRV